MWMYQYLRNQRMALVTITLLFTATIAWSSNRVLTLQPGAVETIKLGNIKRVAVGLDSIAAASVLDTGELLVIARAAGTTDIKVWTEGDRPHNIRLNVRTVVGKSAEEALKAALSGLPGVTVREEAGLLIIDGDVPPSVIERSKAILEKVSETGLVGPNVLNLLHTETNPTDPMIRMDVRFVEINKGALQKLGIRWNSTMPGFSAGLHRAYTVNPAFGVVSPEAEELVQTISVTDQNFYGYFGITSLTSSIIDMLGQDNQAKTLAAPVLVTQSGTAAKFLSGGELPIPMANNFGGMDVEYKKYGVSLEVTPVIDKDNTITSEIFTEVSSVDESVTVLGVPGLLTRNTKSVISVKPGQTMVISGIIKAEDSKVISKIPYLGDIPILGELFKSRDFNTAQSELVVFVTPRLTSADADDNLKILNAAKQNIEQMKSSVSIDSALLD